MSVTLYLILFCLFNLHTLITSAVKHLYASIYHLCFLLKKTKTFYLAVLGLSSRETFSCDVWDLVHCPGIKPRTLHWEHRILATGPPGKSPLVFPLL